MIKFLLFFLISFNSYALTCQEAKEIIAEIKPKEEKTQQDIARLKNAIIKLAGCWGQ